MEQNKFDIDKFWDNFLDEEDETDDLDTLDTKKNDVDVLSADSDNDIFKTVNNGNGGANNISRPHFETTNNSGIKMTNLNDIGESTLSKNATDKIINDDTLSMQEKDKKLAEKYSSTLSRNDQDEIRRISVQKDRPKLKQTVKNEDEEDDLADFAKMEKEYSSGRVKSVKTNKDKKTPQIFQKIKDSVSNFKGEDYFANSGTKMLWFLLVLTIISTIGIILIILFL